MRAMRGGGREGGRRGESESDFICCAIVCSNVG